MDAELSQLVQRFQRLQQEEVQSAISERNAVEIATAIVQKKLLELLFTTDAKEYLTWDQLRREVVDEVMASGGRLNVVDLPSLLSVSPQQIERVMANVLEDDRLLLEGGELISTDHLDGLVAKAQDRLTEEGSLAIADFASTHRLTSTFALHLLTKAIADGRLHAVMDKGATYTTDFVQAQCIMARAGLMAATKQICMEDFVRRHHLFLPLLDVVIERIAAEVPGTFDGHLYSPHAFASYRREQIDNVYRSNGFVGYAVLQRLGVANPRLYMLQRFNGVEDVLLANTREEVVTATKSKGKKKRQTGGNNNNNNASASVSSSVVGAAATEDHPLSGFALANGFLADRSISGMVGLQQLEDEEVLALHLPPQLPVGVDAERDGLGLLPHFIHHFGRLADCIYLPEHALFLNPKAGDVVREVVHGVLHPTSPSSAPQQQDSFDLRSHPAAMEALAEKLHLGPVEECDELLMAVVEHWSTVVDALVAEAQLSQQDRAKTKRKHAMAQLQQQMQQAWIRINLLAKGIAWAQAKLDESALQSISRQVLSSHGLQLCRLVVMNEGYEAMMEDVEEDDEAHAAAAITTGSLRKKIRTFKTTTQKVLLPLVELVEGKDLNALVGALEESSTSGSIAVSSFYQPNKKMEREASAAMIHELRGHLETCSLAGADAAAAGRFFAQACSFLLHACARVHVEVSGKAVSAVVAFLRQEPGVSDTLAEVHGIVVEALNQQSLSADAAAALEAFRHKVLMGEGA